MPRNIPTNTTDSISVKDFFSAYQKVLALELVAGKKGMNKVIRDTSINRPALALTGYYKFFAFKRIQLFGAGEMAYLRDQNFVTQTRIMEEMVAKHIPCVIISRGLAPTKAMVTACEEANVPLLRSSLGSKDFQAEATVRLEERFAPRATLYGTLLDIKGIGVLIRGKSGVGKSECALALIERGHSLVADDITYTRLVGSELLGTSSELGRGYMECRGLGIINIAEMFGIRSVRKEKRIDLVITFREWEHGMNEERTGLEKSYFEILEQQVPHIEIPVKPGRDMARLTEAAAMSQALKAMGHDSAEEFNNRLIAMMNPGMKTGA